MDFEEESNEDGVGRWEREREPEPFESEDTKIKPDIAGVCACILCHSL